MRYLIIVIFLIISLPVYALFGIGGEKGIECEPQPGQCYYTIRIIGDDGEPGVYYVFRATCGNIEQVGVIDEIDNHIKELKNLKVISNMEYKTNQKKLEFIELIWGKLEPIQFYQQ